MSSSHSRPPVQSSESWCQHRTPLGIVADQSQHLLHMGDHTDQLLGDAVVRGQLAVVAESISIPPFGGESRAH